MREFSDNPFDYLLCANGMKSNNTKQTNTILNLHEDTDDDFPILPLMSDDEDDDQLLSTFPIIVEQNRGEQTDSFIAEQEAIQATDADIPDADQLGMAFNSFFFLNKLSLSHRMFNAIFT
jgi:hypothetical protein